jgi:hypothetical protein
LIGMTRNHEMCGTLYLGRDGLAQAAGEQSVGTLDRRMTGLTPQDEDRQINGSQRGGR